jgi:iron(III) transport system permease protein
MIRSPLNPLLVVSATVAALVGLPVASVLTNILSGGTGTTWSHLAATVLPDYIANTLVLCLTVGLGVVVVGVATAWLTTMHDFPGRRVFEWALVLPMAMPAYVLAYVYTDFLQFVGPLQSFPARELRLEQGRLLVSGGSQPRRRHRHVRLRPLSLRLSADPHSLHRACQRHARGFAHSWSRAMVELLSGLVAAGQAGLAAGATLALMETLADYGTVSYFGVQTFTTGIYRAWFSLGDRIAAAQLAAALLAFVILLLVIEHHSRGRARFHNTSGRHRHSSHRLPGWRAWLATGTCALPLGIGFLLPAYLLLRLALQSDGDSQFSVHFLALARNSFLLAGLTAIMAVALALLLAYGARLSRGLLAPALNRLVGLGYAVPGSVIAVGVLIPVTRLDQWLAGQWQYWFGENPGLLLTGGVAALVYAYLVRFLAVALQSVGSSLARITANMDDAARSLGLGQAATLRRVHLPILRGSLFTACLLVFVDVMKELPATLVMRPFDFDTLATQAYTLASDERLAEAASVSLAIVAVGLLPLIVLSRQISRRRR